MDKDVKWFIIIFACVMTIFNLVLLFVLYMMTHPNLKCIQLIVNSNPFHLNWMSLCANASIAAQFINCTYYSNQLTNLQIFYQNQLNYNVKSNFDLLPKNKYHIYLIDNYNNDSVYRLYKLNQQIYHNKANILDIKNSISMIYTDTINSTFKDIINDIKSPNFKDLSLKNNSIQTIIRDNSNNNKNRIQEQNNKQTSLIRYIKEQIMPGNITIYSQYKFGIAKQYNKQICINKLDIAKKLQDNTDGIKYYIKTESMILFVIILILFIVCCTAAYIPLIILICIQLYQMIIRLGNLIGFLNNNRNRNVLNQVQVNNQVNNMRQRPINNRLSNTQSQIFSNQLNNNVFSTEELKQKHNQFDYVKQINLSEQLNHQMYPNNYQFKQYQIHNEQSICSICLSNDSINTLTFCGHYFHLNCIIKWLSSSKSCPCCRSSQFNPIKIYCVTCGVIRDIITYTGKYQSRSGISIKYFNALAQCKNCKQKTNNLLKVLSSQNQTMVQSMKIKQQLINVDKINENEITNQKNQKKQQLNNDTL